jgi:N-methylhydantoinase A/oxoprolinase/acetone carboxylase beta subunit
MHQPSVAGDQECERTSTTVINAYVRPIGKVSVEATAGCIGVEAPPLDAIEWG